MAWKAAERPIPLCLKKVPDPLIFFSDTLMFKDSREKDSLPMSVLRCTLRLSSQSGDTFAVRLEVQKKNNKKLLTKMIFLVCITFGVLMVLYPYSNMRKKVTLHFQKNVALLFLIDLNYFLYLNTSNFDLKK